MAVKELNHKHDGGADHKPPPNVMEDPVKAVKVVEEQEVRGPVARLTPGKMGNFEPKHYPSKNGPGKIHTRLEMIMQLRYFRDFVQFSCYIKVLECLEIYKYIFYKSALLIGDGIIVLNLSKCHCR